MTVCYCLDVFSVSCLVQTKISMVRDRNFECDLLSNIRLHENCLYSPNFSFETFWGKIKWCRLWCHLLDKSIGRGLVLLLQVISYVCSSLFVKSAPSFVIWVSKKETRYSYLYVSIRYAFCFRTLFISWRGFVPPQKGNCFLVSQHDIHSPRVWLLLLDTVLYLHFWLEQSRRMCFLPHCSLPDRGFAWEQVGDFLNFLLLLFFGVPYITFH